jgi:hypothetical protein
VAGSGWRRALTRRTFGRNLWNADLKDDLERTLNRRVCQGRMTLAEAQGAIRTNWIDAYRRYESGRAKGNR